MVLFFVKTAEIVLKFWKHLRTSSLAKSFAMLEAVTEDDVRAVITKLVELAKGGDLAAIREVLNRTVGKADVARDPDCVDDHAAEIARQRRLRDRFAALDEHLGI